MDVAASEFYGTDKTYDLNFKEEASYYYTFLNNSVYNMYVNQHVCVAPEGLIS